MRPLHKGLLLASLHTILVLGVGARFLLDRATLPKAWARTRPVDPDLPIRGRYVSLQIEPQAEKLSAGTAEAVLRVEDGRLLAAPLEGGAGGGVRLAWFAGILVVAEPVAFFIPEHVPDPSRRPPGEELWVEVSVPPKGPPRPIRLGVKKDGVLTPLHLN